MTLSLRAIFLLGSLPLCNAADLTLVYQSNELDYEWSSATSRTQALADGTFDPKDMKPCFIDVFKNRIFLALNTYHISTIPDSLVSLPTSSTSSAFPKLEPLHLRNGIGNNDKIIEARGMKRDSKGRLWSLDSGSEKHSAKLRIINSENEETIITHQFSFHEPIYDLVLDETPDGTFAYISRLGERNIIVFSLERNQSWIANIPEKRPDSIALSPKKPGHLYFSCSKKLYSIPFAELRNGQNGLQTANPKLIGEWKATPYSMEIDKQGFLYAAFNGKNYISYWNTSQQFEELLFHEVPGLNCERPFSFAPDENGTFWIFVYNRNGDPKYSLYKVEELSGATSGGEENVAENATGLHVIWIVILGGGVLLLLVIALWLGYNYCLRSASLNCFGSPNSNQQSAAASGDDERSKNSSTEVEFKTEVNRNDIS